MLLYLYAAVCKIARGSASRDGTARDAALDSFCRWLSSKLCFSFLPLGMFSFYEICPYLLGGVLNSQSAYELNE